MAKTQKVFEDFESWYKAQFGEEMLLSHSKVSELRDLVQHGEHAKQVLKEYEQELVRRDAARKAWNARDWFARGGAK